MLYPKSFALTLAGATYKEITVGGTADVPANARSIWFKSTNQDKVILVKINDGSIVKFSTSSAYMFPIFGIPGIDNIGNTKIEVKAEDDSTSDIDGEYVL